MRDIRTDLKERLSQIETERQTLKSRLDLLNRQELTLKTLIEQEEGLWAQQGLFAEPTPDSAKPRTMLGNFLIRAMADQQPKTLQELKGVAVARGIDFGGKKPGRVIHFALLGMEQNKEVEMLGKGVWKLSRNGAS